MRERASGGGRLESTAGGGVRLALAAAAVAALGAGHARAEVWTRATPANPNPWNVPGNWNNGAGPFPDGIGSTADFSTIDITNNTQVQINDSADDNEIITGTLKVGDTNGNNVYSFLLGTGQTWTFNGGAGPALIERPSVAGTNDSTFTAGFRLASNLKVENNASTNLRLNLNGVISETGGSYGIEVGGVQPVIIANANTFSGGFTLSSASVRVGTSTVKSGSTITSGPLGTGKVTLKGGVLMSSAGAGVGNRILDNPIDFDGDVTLGGTSGGVAGTLTFTGDATLLRNVKITTGSNGVLDFQGVISESAGGSKNLSLSGSGANANVTFSAANTYSGTTFLPTNAKLTLNNSNALQNSTVDVSGSGIQLKFLAAVGPTFTFGGLSGGTDATNLPLQNESGGSINLRIGNNDGDASFSGVLEGPGNLIKIGLGTQTLNTLSVPDLIDPNIMVPRPNTYSGTTHVMAGTLIVNSLNNGAGAVLVDAGATLGGNGSIAAPVTVDGTLAPGASTGAMTLASLDLNGGADSSFQVGGTTRGAAAGGYDAVLVTGQLVLDGTVHVVLVDGFEPAVGDSFDLLDWGSIDASGFSVASDLFLPTLDGSRGWDTSAFLSNGVISVILVPEPSAAGLAAVTLSWMVRRRRGRSR